MKKIQISITGFSQSDAVSVLNRLSIEHKISEKWTRGDPLYYSDTNILQVDLFLEESASVSKYDFFGLKSYVIQEK